MLTSRHASVFFTLVLFAFFLSATAAKAQTAVNYRFLEVVDTAGKPVADAKVETLGPGTLSTQQTDGNGTVRQMPVYNGDFNTRGFMVSKPGYLTYEERNLVDAVRYRKLLEGEIPRYDPSGPIKVVLLKIPATTAEREAVVAEQRRRALLLAVKEGDAAAVEKLLQAGVSADAADVNGIPAILWAAAGGDKRTIKALLAAGADVRNKGRPGRKALLYYLDNVKKEAADAEVVQSLIRAGADVNAANKFGTTVLTLAKQSGDAKIIKLLETAAAH